MNYELLFKIASALALCGWATLVLAPGWQSGRRFIVGGIVTLALSAAYSALFPLAYLRGLPGGFSSLRDVSLLLNASESVLLAAWIHYLAFDLLIGNWIVGDAQKRGISHLWRLPPLAGTFLFGPAGWLLYRIIRWIHPRLISNSGSSLR